MNKHTKELTTKSHDELVKLLGEKREALRAFRFGMKGSRTRDTQGGANLRREVARILTILKQTTTK